MDVDGCGYEGWMYHMNHLASGDEHRRNCPACQYTCVNTAGQSIRPEVKEHIKLFDGFQKSGVKNVRFR
jgi:hypothetical protein